MAQSLKKLHSFFLLTFTIASIASDMSRHMNGFAILLTSSLRHPKIFIKEFGDFLMPCHQHCLSVYLLVQR